MDRKRPVRDATSTSQLAFAVRTLLGIGKSEVAVEFGCGSAELISSLVGGRNGDAELYACDVNPERLRLSGQATSEPETRLIACDVYELPFRSESVDLAVWRKLFCVLREPVRALETICRIVKRGGQVVGIEPAGPQQFYVPGDQRFAELSIKMNRAFRRGWRRYGADQDIGLKMPQLFARVQLDEIAVEGVVDVHLLGDHRRSEGGLLKQLQTEASRLPRQTVELLIAGGLTREELEEHRQRAGERLHRFVKGGRTLDDSLGGYVHVMAPLVVTSGRKID